MYSCYVSQADLGVYPSTATAVTFANALFRRRRPACILKKKTILKRCEYFVGLKKALASFAEVLSLEVKGTSTEKKSHTDLGINIGTLGGRFPGAHFDRYVSHSNYRSCDIYRTLIIGACHTYSFSNRSLGMG